MYLNAKIVNTLCPKSLKLMYLESQPKKIAIRHRIEFLFRPFNTLQASQLQPKTIQNLFKMKGERTSK
jgi:hypothetical protein